LSAEEQTAYRVAQANLVIMPYLVLAGTLFALAAIVRLFHLPPLAQAEGGATSASAQGWRAALAKRQLRGGVIAIFVYVGAEVAIGSLMINFLSLPTVGKMSEAEAAGYVSLYWGGAMVGRFIGFLLLRKIDPGRLLAIFAAIAALMAGMATVTEGSVALWSVVGIGLFNSIMFPTIFTLGIARMGAMTDKASSLLIMGIVGGAIVPVITGVIADRFGEHLAFVPAVLCYLYIVYYGWRGSRVSEGEDAAPSASPVVVSGH
jgi:FHS family L-fucose permease-like MFS transporter